MDNIKMIFFCIFIIIVIFLIFYIKIETVITFDKIKSSYNIVRSKNYYICFSILEYLSKNFCSINYKYLDFIDSKEKTTNMFLKSKISIKINKLGKTEDEILEKLNNLCSYAKKRNIFIWISALYKDTLDDEYYYYNKLRERFNNVGITLSCSHSSVSKKVDSILQNNGNIRLVKGTYNGDISNYFTINNIFLENAKKLCNSNNYQCIATHDFHILSKLNLNKNKNLELSFYFKNIEYVEKQLNKNKIIIKNISFYSVYGNKIITFFDEKIKLPYYYKKKILFRPFHNYIY